MPALRLADQLSEFPVVGGNRFELLPVYDAAIERVVAEVDGARRYVHMLFYIFEDDDVGRRVADALARAAQRGVAVRVLMDAIGSRAGLKGLGPGLRAAGAEVLAGDAAAAVGPERRALRPAQSPQDRRRRRRVRVSSGRRTSSARTRTAAWSTRRCSCARRDRSSATCTRCCWATGTSRSATCRRSPTTSRRRQFRTARTAGSRRWCRAARATTKARPRR